MPRSPEQCAVIRDRRRNKILEKSLHLFALKGFDEVSVDDIMSATNCSHGLFYHYFSGKEDIYNALMKEKEERYQGYLIPREEIIKAGGLAGITILCQYCEKLINADDDLVCFAAGVSEVGLRKPAAIGEVFGELLAKLADRRVEVDRRDMLQLADLLLHFLDDVGMAVADRDGDDAGERVEVPLTRLVP